MVLIIVVILIIIVVVVVAAIVRMNWAFGLGPESLKPQHITPSLIQGFTLRTASPNPAEFNTSLLQGTPCFGGGFPKLGVPFLGGHHNEGYSIVGSILGSPYLGKLPLRLQIPQPVLKCGTQPSMAQSSKSLPLNSQTQKLPLKTPNNKTPNPLTLNLLILSREDGNRSLM